ncbi:hypothetical protein TTHERM_00888040 (macronuclear) [Tetrahymena thermophila SB210]|uniref:Kinase domain protein n=1 Tax=Tetrahymena thermophila (strain SB210) TaxID=312017 RepID=Q23U96_TETTS|nr:hypothetical protein TTHERM_00888040 [Tetrahymena thermophila SB210]EAS00048.3 hypothetical protein TTHERM_00888040 [Tetrahymena thermophila SB210]|eukprot:XP_001020293.3 hypothetical protein TTHERM_00888040 [Tetrahymena thermophila SB210]
MSQLKQKKYTKIKNFYCSYFSKHQILQFDLSTNFLGSNSRLGIGLSRCENLIDLYLNFNKCQLKIVGMQKLCDGLVKCNKLEFLQMDFTKNMIKNEGASILGTYLKNIVNLEQLSINLKKNKIGNIGVKNLVQGIGQSQKLKRLRLILDENNIDKGANDLALSSEYLGNSLQVLDISLYGNQIDCDCELETGIALLNLPNLKSLVLNFTYQLIRSEFTKESIFDQQNQQNQISLENQHNLLAFSLYSYQQRVIQNNERYQLLISALAQKTKLLHLEFFPAYRYENLKDDICHVLENCLNISTLSLMLNDFADKDVQVLGSVLEKNTNIQKLFLFLQHNNKLGDQGTLQLFNSLPNIINLQNLLLDLSYKQINDQGIQNLGIALIKCINLKDLKLRLYQIGDQGVKLLFSSLAKCTNISNLSLNLRGNQIGDDGISLLTFNQSLQVLSLDFGYNNISRSVLNLAHQLACINLQSLTLNLFYNKINLSQKLAVESECLKSKRLVVFKINFLSSI